MTDEDEIGAVIDEMYDSISGPKGPRGPQRPIPSPPPDDEG